MKAVWVHVSEPARWRPAQLTHCLCILSFCPCSPRHAALKRSKSNAATGGFVSIHIIIPHCYFVVPLNTLKQLESHMLMPPYATVQAGQWRPSTQSFLPHFINHQPPLCEWKYIYHEIMFSLAVCVCVSVSVSLF